MTEEKKRIAIVGSGVSGLSALYTLRNTTHEIHLFEAAERLGGHTNTVVWDNEGEKTAVDTGFIVLNTATYPNFIAFLKDIGVDTMPTEMTFGVSRDEGAFEWSGTNLISLFAQPSNALKPSFWRMIFDIVRFNSSSLSLLSLPPTDENLKLSIGAYLEREGYSDAFRDDYLIPMTACVWSTGPDKCALEFPAITLVRFLWNHHLLSTIAERPPWLTIPGGSKKYIDAVIKASDNATIHLSTPVKAAIREKGMVRLHLGGRAEAQEELFDEVILACHGDQARSLIRRTSTFEEKRILQAFQTTPNTAYLHSDLSLMPRRTAAWSAWNYLTTSSPKSPSSDSSNPSGALQTVSLTYNMNTLQSLSVREYGDILVTLNPPHPPAKDLTKATFEYRHPLYNAAMVSAQETLEHIQGKRGIWYAGAWTGYGFHEDGFTSGMRVGLRLGGAVSWEPRDAKFSRGSVPMFKWQDYVVSLVVWVLQVYISILERFLGIGAKREGVKIKGRKSTDGAGAGTAAAAKGGGSGSVEIKTLLASVKVQGTGAGKAGAGALAGAGDEDGYVNGDGVANGKAKAS